MICMCFQFFSRYISGASMCGCRKKWSNVVTGIVSLGDVPDKFAESLE